MRKRTQRTKQPQKSIRELLKEGSRRRAALNRALAEEWFPLDEEAWEVGEAQRRAPPR
jgi:hypothetical protein